MIFHIAARELRSLFLSPLAWSILAVVQFILAFLFLNQMEQYAQLQPQLALLDSPPGITELIAVPLFGNATIILLLVIPLLSMRLISEERRSQTLPLLFSAPISMTEIILGKYLALVGFLLIMLGMLALMPLSLLLAGELDWGLLFSSLLGLSLLLAAFAAAGLYMSTLTEQPTVAAIATFGLLLLFWIINLTGSGEGQESVAAYLSMQKHYQALLKGLFRSSDVIYYLLFSLSFIVFSIRRLDADRLQK